MRVIAGKFRSRPLRSLPGMDTRPTSDRLRETLFNVLTSGDPQALEGSKWLDVYAGTGAVGIEALSRGAALVTFIESSRAAAKLIRENLKSLEAGENFQLLEQDASKALRTLQSQFDYIFLDPPYRQHEAYSSTLAFLAQSSLLCPDTLVVAEHDKRFDPGDAFPPLYRTRTLNQGDSCLSFYRLKQ